MKECFYPLNNLNICVRQWIHSSKPQKIVLILHGWLDQSASWDPIAQYLYEHNCSVIVPDHRGHGLSEHISPSSHYHFPDYVADIALLHQRFDDTPLHIIGHSMGGTIASIYSALFPTRVCSLTLIEGLGPAEESSLDIRNRYKKHLLQRLKPRSPRIFSAPKEALHKYVQHYDQLTAERAMFLSSRLLKKNEHGWQWCYDPRHKDKSAISFSLSRHLELLSEIACPTFLIHGSVSPYKKWINIEQRKDALPNLCGEYLIDGGHSPHMENHHALSIILDKILSAPL